MRGPRRIGALAINVLLGVSGMSAAPSATAVVGTQGYDGRCVGADAKTGTTFVIDFQQLDGNAGRPAPTLVRCSPSPDPSKDRTGLEAMKDAGIEPTGVQRWGEAFICRIEGRPTAEETLDVSGNSSYRERCIDTPPGSAYWSYWHADGRGQDWQYSQWGVMARTVAKGGFEGWSFSYNATAETNPAPRLEPLNAALDPDSPTASLSFDLLEARITVGEKARIVWGSTQATRVVAASVSPASGGGSWSGQLLAPGGSRTLVPTRPGTYTYTVRADGNDDPATASATLTVLPLPAARLSVSSTSEPVLRGRDVRITGSGLRSGEVYTVSLAGRAVTSGAADSRGRLVRSIRIAPSTPAGRQAVRVEGSSTNRVGTRALTVVGAKSLAPHLSRAKVRRHGRFTVSVKGLAAREKTTIVYAGRSHHVRANAKGVVSRRLSAGGRLGRRTVTVRGAFASRHGTARVTVVR